jgi:hypothetical protein
MCSDNAATHFKSTGAMEYFTSLIKKLGRDATKCHYVYSYGAPGHGKENSMALVERSKTRYIG